MRRPALFALAILALPAVALAQPEDRLRAPTGGVASVDPCADAAMAERARTPEPTWPGFDPRLPAPAGATSFTGIAPLGRDPSRALPQPSLPDQAYQACRQRLNR
jgi:hypothetical protein